MPTINNNVVIMNELHILKITNIGNHKNQKNIQERNLFLLI